MSKTIQWSVATTPEVKATLYKMAQMERRSLSALAGLLLERALQAEGSARADVLPADDRLQSPTNVHVARPGVQARS